MCQPFRCQLKSESCGSTSHASDCMTAARTGDEQVYLGGFDTEEQAALAYDIATVRFRGRGAITNFAMSNYEQELDNLTEVRVLPACLSPYYMLCR